MTADVDVTVDVPPNKLAAFLSALDRAGFVARVQDVAAFATKTRVLPFVHAATSLPLDIVLAGDGLEMLFLDRVRKIEIGGLEAPVISPEDLVVAKILAGRPKDLDDIRGVVAQHPELDEQQVRKLLAELDELLERADLLPAFDALKRG